MPDKLTDSEIKKALECKPKAELVEMCNRLQAENERLRKGWKADIQLTAEAKAEAYKECIEKVISKSIYNPMGMFYIVPEEWLKELVGRINVDTNK